MKVLLMMFGGIGGDYTYLRNLYNNPPPGVIFDICLPEKLSEWLRDGCIFEEVKKFDLIHLHSWFPPLDNLWSLDLFRKINKPFCSSFATTIWDCHKMYWHKHPYFRMIKWFIYSHLGNTKTLIAWSERAKLSAIRQFRINPENIYVVPPYVKMGTNSKKINDIRLCIGFIGNDFERKGGFILLEAFRKLRQKYDNIYLRIITDYKIDAEKDVQVDNPMYHEELYNSFYPECDIFVLPTNYEVFGLVNLEAMSFGIPVVTTNVYAMREIISNGKDGFLISPNDVKNLTDVLDLLVRDGFLRKKIGQEARRKIQDKFSPEESGPRLKKVYDRCLKHYSNFN